MFQQMIQTINLLMILNGERRWYYLAVKKLSTLLIGIKC